MSTDSSYSLRGEERQRMWLIVSSSEMFRFLMLLSLVATSPQSVSANIKIPTKVPSSNLFNEYITRGLFTCTRDYVKSLTDLHVLMRELYENYQSCKQQVKDADKTYPQTPFAYLNDLMRRYQMADKSKDVKDIEKEIIADPKKTSL